MNASLARPRARLCQKSFDGQAAVQIMLLQRTVGCGHAEVVGLARSLLEHGFPVSDVHRLTGLNRTMLRRLSAEMGRDPSERVGRIPSRMGYFLDLPLRHLWLSVFLDRLDRFRMHWQAENRSFVSGRAMLAAIRGTTLACGELPAAQGKAHVRYLMLAAEMLCERQVRWLNCARCNTRYAALIQREAPGVLRTTGTRCPLCAIASPARHAGGDRLAAAG